MPTKNIYLNAYYTARPRDPRQTHVKGYMSDPANIAYDERIEFAKGEKKSAISTAGVILNLNTKKIERNRFGDGKTFDELFKYFLEAYPQYVIQVMAQLDMAYLEQFIPKEETVEESSDTVDVEEKPKKSRKKKSADEKVSAE